MIVPSIDLMGGKAVQLIGGEKKALEVEDVISLAKKFSICGEVAVIDLDAAMNKGSNLELIKQICSIADCRVGGGIRTKEKAKELFRAGAKKIIIGTNANKEFLMELPKEKIIVAVDTKDGQIVTEGWKTKTQNTAKEQILKLKDYCSGFLYTNVNKEGRMQGADIDTIKELSKLAKITAAGGISTYEEIAELENLSVDSQLGMSIYTGKIDLTESLINILDFEKNNGLIPTIVQDLSGQVLMLAYSTSDSLRIAIEKKRGAYYSRSRKQLWIKGDTSDNIQKLVRVKYDCDRDTLLFVVDQKGVACHNGSYSCFGEQEFNINSLYNVIKDRIDNPKELSYTTKIASKEESIMEKIKEESDEVINYQDIDNLIWEIGDLTYFLNVLMAKKGIKPKQIVTELASRVR